MTSILLDRTTWDLVLDANHNLAVCTDTYQVLQDVATAIRTWYGEAWYDTSLGVPYDDGIFDGTTPLPILKSNAERVALTVPNVAQAQCLFVLPTKSREIRGAIAITLTSGETASVNF